MAPARSARLDDLPALLDLYAQLDPHDPTLDPDDELTRHWAELLADEDLDMLVVDADGRPVSTCVRSVTKNPTRNARPFAAVENVVAHEDYRGQGYGRQVLEAALDRAGARDCEKVMLLTGTDREWTLAFYEECGFDRENKTLFVRYLSD